MRPVKCILSRPAGDAKLGIKKPHEQSSTNDPADPVRIAFAACEKNLSKPQVRFPLLGRKLVSKTPMIASPGGIQPHKHEVEREPIEGARKVTAEALLVQAAEAGQAGEGGPASVGEEHAEELHEEVALALSDGGVAGGAHFCEDETERGLNERWCEHRSRGRLAGTTDLRPMTFSCNSGR